MVTQVHDTTRRSCGAAADIGQTIVETLIFMF